MILKLAAVLILGAVFAAGCGSNGGDDDTGATLLDPAAYQAAISEGDAFVVNVHIPYEGEIEGTDAFISFEEIKAQAALLPDDKSAPLYIYCMSGRMSGEATPDLQALGYTNIIDLEGGMQAWQDAGLPLLQRDAAGP